MKTKAREFACKYHGEKRYGEHPYVVHLDAVAEIVQQYGEPAVVIAYLHDVVEDTEVTIDDLADEGFPTEVLDAIQALTKLKG